jgi:predicted nucleic acid-binding protein
VNRFIIDASVALKWCLPAQEEAFTAQAEKFLETYRSTEVMFFVPDLFWPEIGNALWKAVWKGRIVPEQAQKSYAKITDLNFSTVPSLDFVPDALQLAMMNGRSVYDSIYVVLAQKFKAELITADERLANALAARFPVKWLGGL